MKRFIVITAFMDTGDRFRRRNLAASVRNTARIFPDADILVAEAGSSRWLKTQELPCDRIQVGDESDQTLFCKSACLNRAVRARPGYDAYVMVDADVLLDKKTVEYIVANPRPESIMYPYGDCLYLHEADTARVVSGEAMVPGSKNHGIVITKQTGLCVVFTQETFDRVGGFDEVFIGWGAEDDAFMIKCRRLCGPVVRNADRAACVMHMFHVKVNNPAYLESPHYRRNRQACACIRRMSDADLGEYVSGRVQLRELISKYEARGRLELEIRWRYTPAFVIKMDATLYDVDRSVPLSLPRILDALNAEDGPGFVVEFIDSLLVKVKDMSEEQKAECQALRDEYAAKIRG